LLNNPINIVQVCYPDQRNLASLAGWWEERHRVGHEKCQHGEESIPAW